MGWDEWKLPVTTVTPAKPGHFKGEIAFSHPVWFPWRLLTYHGDGVSSQEVRRRDNGEVGHVSHDVNDGHDGNGYVDGSGEITETNRKVTFFNLTRHNGIFNGKLVQWFFIIFFVIFCQIVTVVNGGRNLSTWRKPPPNPKSLNNGHNGNGDEDGSGKITEINRKVALFNLPICHKGFFFKRYLWYSGIYFVYHLFPVKLHSCNLTGKRWCKWWRKLPR